MYFTFYSSGTTKAESRTVMSVYMMIQIWPMRWAFFIANPSFRSQTALFIMKILSQNYLSHISIHYLLTTHKVKACVNVCMGLLLIECMPGRAGRLQSIGGLPRHHHLGFCPGCHKGSMDLSQWTEWNGINTICRLWVLEQLWMLGNSPDISQYFSIKKPLQGDNSWWTD